MYDIIWNSKAKVSLEIRETWKNNNIRNKVFFLIREKVYRNLADYNTIAYAHYRVTQYKIHEDYISNVVNDKMAVRNFSVGILGSQSRV